MSEPGNDRHALKEFPKARSTRSWQTYFFWLVPVGAALLAGWFVYTEVFRKGPEITIFFNDAGGLEPGKSQLKFRGVKIGSIEKVELAKQHERVKVTVSLEKSAEDVAREGSKFWIVKPRIDVGQVLGLRTIVAGEFITVEPGDGNKKTEFNGIPEPPLALKKDTRRFVLLTEKLGSQKKRTPVFYRGIKVGEVADCDLGPTAQTVRITIDIITHYLPLVRTNTKFWDVGGINVSAGILSGLEVSAQSAQTLVTGGIAFATPDTREKEAPDGTTFRLYEKPENDWLSWSPSIRLHHQKGGD